MTMFHVEQEQEQDSALQLWLTDPDDKTFDSTSMRLSTACVCRRLREWVKPDLYHAFPEYLDARGHGFEQILAVNLERTGHTFQREVKVPWAHGESGIDFLVTAGPMCEDKGGTFVIELKANKEAEIKTENRQQLQRQRRCLELHAARMPGAKVLLDEIGDRWFVYVIDPVTWRIPNPSGYQVPLDDERRAEVDAELELTSKFAAKIDKLDVEWETNWPLCTCGSCWRKAEQALPSKQASQVASVLVIQDELKYGAGQEKLAKQPLREWLAEEARVRGHADVKALAAAEGGGLWIGGGVALTLSKSGAMSCRTYKAKTL